MKTQAVANLQIEDSDRSCMDVMFILGRVGGGTVARCRYVREESLVTAGASEDTAPSEEHVFKVVVELLLP